MLVHQLRNGASKPGHTSFAERMMLRCSKCPASINRINLLRVVRAAEGGYDMADNPFGFWSEEWLRAHENYWNAWQALSGVGKADTHLWSARLSLVPPREPAC